MALEISSLMIIIENTVSFLFFFCSKQNLAEKHAWLFKFQGHYAHTKENLYLIISKINNNSQTPTLCAESAGLITLKLYESPKTTAPVLYV